MTLSPGQKVQPKRSMRTSTGGVQCLLQLNIERAGTETAPVHRAEHLDVAYRVKPKAFRDALLHDRQQLPHPLFRVRGVDKVRVPAFGRCQIGRQAIVDAMRIADNPALGGLPENLGQTHDRDGTRSDDISQHLSRTDRWQAAHWAETGALTAGRRVPFTRALNKRLGLPVYDIYPFVNWFHAGLNPRGFNLPRGRPPSRRPACPAGRRPRRSAPASAETRRRSGRRIKSPAGRLYWSSQTSSMRQPLKMLLTMIVSPLTQGCRQVASLV